MWGEACVANVAEQIKRCVSSGDACNQLERCVPEWAGVGVDEEECGNSMLTTSSSVWRAIHAKSTTTRGPPILMGVRGENSMH